MDKANDQAAKVAQSAPAAPATMALPPTKATTSATVIQIERPKASESDVNGMIPAWLALVGVIVTIIGKWVADWFQRKHEFKRQLYLDLVDGVQTVSTCIGRLCDKDTALSKTTKQYQKAGHALAKVELAAPRKLSRLMSDFKSTSGAAYMYLMQMRVLIEVCNKDLKLADAQIAIYNEQQRLLLDELRRLSIEGSDDQARRQRVEQYFDGYQGEIKKQQERKVADAVAMGKQTHEMSAVTMQCLESLAVLTPQMLKCARRGLGYYFFDQKDFQKRTEESISKMRKALDDLRESLKRSDGPDGNGDKANDEKKS
jgi:hypothetical protein